MSKGTLAAVVHYLGRIRTAEPAVASDRALLERFVCDADEGAFAALVQRHAAMVLSAAGGVLHNVAGWRIGLPGR